MRVDFKKGYSPCRHHLSCIGPALQRHALEDGYEGSALEAPSGGAAGLDLPHEY